MDRLKYGFVQKRPELVHREDIMFKQNNDTPHISLMTRQKLRQLRRDVLSHPPCNMYIGPCGYYLLLSIAQAFGGEKLASVYAYTTGLY